MKKYSAVVVLSLVVLSQASDVFAYGRGRGYGGHHHHRGYSSGYSDGFLAGLAASFLSQELRGYNKDALYIGVQDEAAALIADENATPSVVLREALETEREMLKKYGEEGTEGLSDQDLAERVFDRAEAFKLSQ